MTDDAFHLPSTAPDAPAEDAPIHPDVLGLAFLLGTWRGVGVGGYPGVGEFRFAQEVEITHRGTPVLAYRSISWLLAEDGSLGRPTASEAGFWRPAQESGVELLLTHSTGVAEIWVGTRDGQKIELDTDVVVRTATAQEVTAGKRLYGLVEGRLLYAYDMAASGHALQSHLSARLDRVGGQSRPFLDHDPFAQG